MLVQTLEHLEAAHARGFARELDCTFVVIAPVARRKRMEVRRIDTCEERVMHAAPHLAEPRRGKEILRLGKVVAAERGGLAVDLCRDVSTEPHAMRMRSSRPGRLAAVAPSRSSIATGLFVPFPSDLFVLVRAPTSRPVGTRHRCQQDRCADPAMLLWSARPHRGSSPRGTAAPASSVPARRANGPREIREQSRHQDHDCCGGEYESVGKQVAHQTLLRRSCSARSGTWRSVPAIFREPLQSHPS